MFADEFVGCVFQQGFCSRIEKTDGAVVVSGDDGDAHCRVEHCFQVGFVIQQSGFGLSAQFDL